MDYKKILEGVVDIINTTEKSDIGFANICTYIGENCPELKESEGERVKKDIKRAISVALDYSYFDKETANNCLAWIEKQGEQKPAEFDDTNAKRMFIKALERVEEQNAKGYKLTDCDKNSWWEDFKACTSCTIEQKPAEWSEEDEKVLHAIRNALNYEKPRNYLKSRDFEFTDILNWLKSLRPQNRWKPSESDILLLEEIANGKSNPQDFQASLWGLIGQLKKLRE